MKILFITPTIYDPPHRVGGAETYIHNLSSSLSQIDLIEKVGILGFSSNRTGKWEQNNISYYVFKSHCIKGNPSNPFPLFNYFELLKWDIIYIQQFHTWITFVCIILAKVFRKKIVLTDHNGGGPTYNRRLHIDKFIDLFLSTSNMSFQEINLNPKKMVPIYGGVDLNTFIPRDLPRSGLLFVGRAHKIKGIIPFLQAAVESNYQGRITLALGVNIENENYYHTIEHFIKTNHLINCIIKKNLSLNELVYEYQSHQWTFLASIDEIPHESLGLTVLESLACDTPVAVSPFCGVSELFAENSYAFIHVLKNPLFFLTNISETNPRGARQWAIENASWDVVAKKVASEIIKI